MKSVVGNLNIGDKFLYERKDVSVICKIIEIGENYVIAHNLEETTVCKLIAINRYERVTPVRERFKLVADVDFEDIIQLRKHAIPMKNLNRSDKFRLLSSREGTIYVCISSFEMTCGHVEAVSLQSGIICKFMRSNDLVIVLNIEEIKVSIKEK